MAKRANQSSKILIDPIFVIPEGSEDEFAYSSASDVDWDEEPSFDVYDDDVSSAVDIDYDEGAEDKDASPLQTPQDITIATPQTLRRAPGGQQVVDIVIVTEDIEGVINYEMQVTKI